MIPRLRARRSRHVILFFAAGCFGVALPAATAPAPQSDKRDDAIIRSPADLEARIPAQLHITNPDFIVFVPEVTDSGVNDTGNEHFLVFDGPDGSLMAVWTQSSAETQPDQHIAFARSTDEGRTWSKPAIIAGPRKPGDGHMASWGYPLVSKSGRIYVLYSQHIGKHDNFPHHTGWLHGIHSDDLGHTWSLPQSVYIARSMRDNPDATMPPNMLCWQKPLRLGREGKYFAGFTRWTSFAVTPNPTKAWISADSRVEFMRFENVDDSPAVADLKIAWFAANEKALSVPFPGHPNVSTCQEPSIVKLPDGRLFCASPMIVEVVNMRCPVSGNTAELIFASKPSCCVCSSVPSTPKTIAIELTKTSRAAKAEINPTPTRQSAPIGRSTGSIF